MKVLIVDDIADNRMAINLLLEEFEDIEAYEAKDGQEAIDICKKDHYDIVFMDIMMPNIDGISATRIIKSFDKKVMILALSALDDEESKNKMLESGAEDYITKPIDDRVFHQRVKNYISIVEYRQQKPLNTNAVNAFTKEVYSRSLKFNIKSLQSLSEFWDYYLNDSSYDVEMIEDCIRILYAYGQFILKTEHSFSVVAEENEENLFLTVSPLQVINDIVIQHTLLKNYKNAIFILKDNELSFRLPKSKTITEDKVEKLELSDYEQEILSKNHFSKTTALSYVEGTAISLMDKIEDLENIEDTIEANAVEFENNITLDTLHNIIEGLEAYIDVLDQLLEFEHLAFALSTLNNILKNLDIQEIDSSLSKKFSVLLIHLLDDLSQWRKNIFLLKEANDIHYLDSSFLSSCLQLQAIFEKKEVEQEDEDDFELF